MLLFGCLSSIKPTAFSKSSTQQLQQIFLYVSIRLNVVWTRDLMTWSRDLKRRTAPTEQCRIMYTFWKVPTRMLSMTQLWRWTYRPHEQLFSKHRRLNIVLLRNQNASFYCTFTYYHRVLLTFVNHFLLLFVSKVVLHPFAYVVSTYVYTWLGAYILFCHWMNKNVWQWPMTYRCRTFFIFKLFCSW